MTRMTARLSLLFTVVALSASYGTLSRGDDVPSDRVPSDGVPSDRVPSDGVPSDGVPSAVRSAEQQRVNAIMRASQSTLAIFSANGQGGGSGVVISADGYALTNFHVSMPCGDHMRCGMSDGKLYDAVIVGLDPTGDVALIKMVGRDDFPAAELGDSDKVRAGDWCLVIGNPFLLATNLQPSVSYGIVSGVHRYQPPAGTLLEYADCIQTDAAINPGNSGGPLFDAEGRLIGINGRGSFEKRGRINVGVGYAISINQIKKFLGQLRSGRILDHATLGATVGTNSEGRVVVNNILRNSDAYRRGLREDDELVTFGGREITTVNGFKNALGIFPKGWRVPLSFRRAGDRFDVMVRLAGVHSQEELLQKIANAPIQESPEPPDPKKPKSPGPSPLPTPKPLAPHASEVPEKVASIIKHRAGFANFYFNELNRDRVWSAHQSHSDLTMRKGEWVLRGASKKGPIEVQLSNDRASITIAGTRFSLEAKTGTGLADQIDPPGSGGLLMALHVWRRLLVAGPQDFGDVTYYGTAPNLGLDGQSDVLEAIYDVSETKFWFDEADGTLLALEMSSDVGVDPCEVYFSDYRPIHSRQFPHRMTVRHGDDIYLEIVCEHVTLAEK